MRHNLFQSKRFEAFREFPGTSFLATSWVVVYLLMLAGQWLGWLPRPEANLFEEVGPLSIGAVSQQTGQIVGAWNTAEILCGQLWRTILATFVHFGLIHIALNMFGLIQLGQLIEEWYGPRLIFGIVILIGFLGNGLAALARPLFGEQHPQTILITSGGGSTVIFGLIGLIAVVGRRSRSRMGQYLYNQMIGLLAFNFIIGLTIPQIDNFAHAGGAIAGALIGRLHYTLIRWNETKPRICRAVFALGLLVIAGSVAGQVWVAGVQQKINAEQARMERLDQLKNALGQVQSRFITRSALGLKSFQTIQPKGRLKTPWSSPIFLEISSDILRNNIAELDRSIDRADDLSRGLGAPAINQAWKSVRASARLAISRPPLAAEIPAFLSEMETLLKSLLKEAELIHAREQQIANRLILVRIPWFNVVWTNLGPALKVANAPPGARRNP